MSVFFVATPIGNIKEITYRAVEILSSSDVIYCEDTRHSAPLLSHYGINKPLLSYHKFNETAVAEEICNAAAQGREVSIISDAGMPSISDPGGILVKKLREKNIPYTVISGASAFVNAFVLSGFSTPFTFIGFLPEKNKDREKVLDSVNLNNTLIFYSSVHDVRENLDYLYKQLGEREICIARELTKLYETVIFGTLGKISPDVEKGEFVLVVGSQKEENPLCALSVEEHINHYITLGQDKMSACKSVAKDRGVSKSEIYSKINK